MSRSAIILFLILDFTASILLFLSLFLKIGLPYLFLFSVIILTISTTSLLLKCNNKNVVIGHLFFLYIVRCSVYFLATSFSVFPFGDPYWDIGVVKTFIQTGKAELIHMENWPSSTLIWMSGWPLLHVFTLSLSSITSLEVTICAMFETFLFVSLFFVFSYLLISYFGKRYMGKFLFIPLALLIFITSPESLFWNIQFKYQTIALLLMMIIFLIVFKTFDRQEKGIQLTLLMIINLFAIVIGHHITALVTITYLLLLVIIFTVISYVIKDISLGKKLYRYVVIASFAFGFLWCMQFAIFVWPSIGSVLSRLIEFLKGLQSVEKTLILASYPNILRPTWGLASLWVRDALIYIPAVLGYLLVLKNLPRRNGFSYLIGISLTIFGMILLIDIMAIQIEPLRVVTYALPFLSIVSALFYGEVIKKQMVVGAVVAVLAITGIIGQWGHNYIPLHLWNSNSMGTSVGEHNPQFMYINEFVNQKLGSYDLIFADDFSLLYALLNPEQYSKIRAIRTDRFDDQYKTVVISFRELEIYFYAAMMAAASYGVQLDTYQEFIELSEKVRKNVNEKMSRVFDLGTIKISVYGRGNKL